MKIADITIGERHRKEMGDIAGLAESINDQGLLQAIGVTPEGELVFGQRRILACLELGWTEIDERIVNVTSIAEGSYAENDMREDFLHSERVAILETITRKAGGDRRSPEFQKQKSAFDQEEAARRAGLGNRTTARAARLVVADGIPALVEAMDRKEHGPEALAVVAKLPAEEQAEIIALPVPERRRAIVAEAERQRAERMGRPKTPKPPRLVYTGVLPKLTTEEAGTLDERKGRVAFHSLAEERRRGIMDQVSVLSGIIRRLVTESIPPLDDLAALPPADFSKAYDWLTRDIDGIDRVTATLRAIPARAIERDGEAS